MASRLTAHDYFHRPVDSGPTWTIWLILVPLVPGFILAKIGFTPGFSLIGIAFLSNAWLRPNGLWNRDLFGWRGLIGDVGIVWSNVVFGSALVVLPLFLPWFF